MNNEKTSPLTSLKTGKGLRCHRARTVINVLITEYSVSRMVHTGTDYFQCVDLKTNKQTNSTLPVINIKSFHLSLSL